MFHEKAGAPFPRCLCPAFVRRDVRTIVIRDGDRHYLDGDSDDVAETASLGRQYAFFERDGVGYVIRDVDALARIRKIVKPQADLGRQQAKLGSKQAALGAKQAALGVRQAALGMKQAATSSSVQARELTEQQRDLSREQQKLSEQQMPLGEQQRVLGEKQRDAGKTARQQLEKLFEDAIRSGLAKRR
jgi:hypothetical protein